MKIPVDKKMLPNKNSSGILYYFKRILEKNPQPKTDVSSVIVRRFVFVDEVLCLVLFRTVCLQLYLHCKTLTETDVLYKSCDFG